MKNKARFIQNDLQIIEPSERLLIIIEKVLEQNKMILEQNQQLITTISSPIISVPREICIEEISKDFSRE